MNKIRVYLIVFFLLTMTTASISAQKEQRNPLDKVKSRFWEPILDADLSQWEVWTGIPESSIMNLPETYIKGNDGENSAPIGLGDPMGIFKVAKGEDGALVLNISGQVYAGLTSKKSYSNYHLTFLFKWGEKKYEPRLERKRDNGLLYHCHGEHGAFWNVWKSSLEYQIQEGDFGDLYTLAGTSAKATIDEEGRWNPKNENSTTTVRTKRSSAAESPHGEWTRIDLYVLEDSAVHVTNGQVVLALTNATSKNGEKLKAGQLQLQSESAECYMKDIHIRPIAEFPKEIAQEAGFIR